MEYDNGKVYSPKPILVKKQSPFSRNSAFFQEDSDFFFEELEILDIIERSSSCFAFQNTSFKRDFVVPERTSNPLSKNCD